MIYFDNSGDQANDTERHRGLSDHSPCKSLRTESTKGLLNVDGDPGSAIIWMSLENDILFPVIALSLLLWSHSLRGRERGDTYKPITARLVKPPSAGHSSISYTPLTPPGEESTGLEPIPNYRVTNTQERDGKTLTCSFSPRTSEPKRRLQINTAFKRRDGLTLWNNHFVSALV